MEKLLKTAEAANYLGVSATTLKRFDQNGKFKPTEVKGNYRYYSVEDLDKFKSELGNTCETTIEEEDKADEQVTTIEEENKVLRERLEKAKDVYLTQKKEIDFYKRKVEEQSNIIDEIRQQLKDDGHMVEINDGLTEFAMYYMNLSRLHEAKMEIGRRFLRTLRWSVPDKSIPDKYKSLCVYLVQSAAEAWNTYLSNIRNNNLPKIRADKLRKALENCFKEPHVPLSDEATAVSPSEAGISVFDFVEDEKSVPWVNTGGFKTICDKAGLWLVYNKDHTAVEVIPIEQRTKAKPKQVEDIGLTLSNVIAEEITI